MKYLRALIILLVLFLIGIGLYYIYIKISPSKPTSLGIVTETPRPVQTIDSKIKSSVITKYEDYTTQDSKKSGKTIVIQGVFQASDGANKEMNGILYKRVIGIVGDDGNLASIWLTSGEYDQISDIVSKFGRHGERVTLTLSSNVVNISTPNGTTKN